MKIKIPSCPIEIEEMEREGWTFESRFKEGTYELPSFETRAQSPDGKIYEFDYENKTMREVRR